MTENITMKNALEDETHPAHEAAKAIVKGLEDGSLSMCACLGPMYGEPYCACQMTQRGMQEQMDNNPLRIADNERSKKQWDEFIQKQEPLPVDMQQVLYTNLWELYEE